MQGKIPQSSQIIHELGIKKEAIVLYHKYSPMPKWIYKYMCVCVMCVPLYVYLYQRKKIPVNAQGCRHLL